MHEQMFQVVTKTLRKDGVLFPINIIIDLEIAFIHATKTVFSNPVTSLFFSLSAHGEIYNSSVSLKFTRKTRKSRYTVPC